MTTTIRNTCFGIFLTLTTFVYSVQNGSWEPTPASPIGELPCAANSIVSSCYDPANNQVFAAWLGQATLYPIYSIYENGSWNAPSCIDESFQVNGTISLCYDSGKAQVLAIGINSDHLLFCTRYVSGSWSRPEVVTGGSDFEFATTYYDAPSQKVFVGITDTHGIPQYMTYDMQFDGPYIIDPNARAAGEVFLCSNGKALIAAWVDLKTKLPMYSMYNSASNVWSRGVAIAKTYTAVRNVHLSYKTKDYQVVATWSAPNKNDRLIFAFLSGSTWNIPRTFDQTTSTVGTIYTVYDSSIDNQVFGAWANSKNDSLPTFSIYRNGAWYADSLIDSADSEDAASPIFLTYNSVDDLVFATWMNTTSQIPMYAIYRYCGAVIQPPLDLRGKQHRCDSLLGSEWCNSLDWDSTPSPEVFAYTIYRNSTLIATVSSRSHHYVDHDQTKGEKIEYRVHSVDPRGNESEPAITTVN